MALLIAIVPAGWAWGGEAAEPTFSDVDVEFFEKEVRPLLVTHCYECHGKGEVEAGLRLTSRRSVLAGGDTGPGVVAGAPHESLLIDAVEYGDLYQMPPGGKLPAKDIQVLVEWVNRGAPWPAGDGDDDQTSVEVFDLEARKREHWSWQPLTKPAPPSVEDTSWPADSLDRFILARLEEAGLQPAPPADPRALVRRAYFDLIGLPPPPEKVEAFAANPTPEAFADLVDQLLASPQFGERWGRHWLDLMRYAETRGHEFDYRAPNAWQYRDYVIRALNADVPYDQFVTEHIAGDLMPEPRRHPTEGFNESVLATGFWFLGEWVHSPVDIRKDETDRFDNAIDVYSKTFLGLTVSCARCHDHKFDAISQEDYYALAGFLQSSAYQQVRFQTIDHNRQIVQRLDALQREAGHAIARQVARDAADVRSRLASMLAAAAESDAIEQANLSSATLEQIAARHNLSPHRLAAWVEQLTAARDDASHPLYPLALSATAGFATASERLTASAMQAPRQLAETHQIVIDFSTADAPWLTDGPAFGGGPLTPGLVLPGKASAQPIAEVVAQGRAELDPSLAELQLSKTAERHDGNLAGWHGREGKMLRVPSVQLTGGKLYYLMRGGARIHAVVDSHYMIAGPLHQSTLKDVANDANLRWVEHDLSRYRGHGVQVEFAPRDDEPLQVLMVVEGSGPPPEPKELLPTDANELLASADSQEELIERLAALIDQSIDRLAGDTPAEHPAMHRIGQWAANHRLLWTDEPPDTVDRLLRDYHARRAELVGQLRKESAIAPAICDVSSEDERFLVRGNPAVPGKLVSRGMLTAIAGDNQPPITDGSGRLELARRTLDPSNPCPSRVMANRVWHHLMGRGIVPSVDNFGVLGQTPTHPELLDHLANRFIEDGWSVKRLIRTIMLSRTYQMSSGLRPEAEALDPQNLLFHRMPARRLEAEPIRDGLLALSGRLDLTQFGPSVPVYLTEFMEGRGRPGESGPIDGNGRRSIYQAVRRNFLAPMMTAFDTPQPVSPRGQRTVSNVPAQALILMNDPFVRAQAEGFAARLKELEADPEQRIARMYQEAVARPPLPEETEAALDFLAEQADQWRSEGDDSSADDRAWADLCHVVFNTKEFIFLR